MCGQRDPLVGELRSIGVAERWREQTWPLGSSGSPEARTPWSRSFGTLPSGTWETPAKEVGGDFYDFFLVDQNHLALVIADVSGNGVPAALFMVIAKTLMKNGAQGAGESQRSAVRKQ